MIHRHALRLLVLAATLAGLGAAWASTPTCEALLDEFATTFDDATAYRVSVAVLQGDSEVAYELAQQTRRPDGSWASETIERRGLRRPGNAGAQDGEGTFGDVPLACDGHELEEVEGGDVVLTLPGREGDEGAITGWSLRFERLGPRWLPSELVADFEATIVFIPVRGRFVTVLSNWRF